MFAATPTRQALRHLRRICSSDFESAGFNTSTRAQHSQSVARPSRTKPLLSATARHGQTRHGCVSVKTFNSTTARRYQSSTPSSDSGTESSQDLQLPDITNYYTLFPRTLPAGPPPSGPFEISLSDLRREFLQLQSLHHPDKYTSSATAQRKSLALSSLLNTAYKTLSDPLLRARYLLHHNYGVDVTTEDNNTHRASTDQATLMEVMEAQEAIEEARTQEQIDQLKTENQARIDDAVKSLGEAFKHEDIEVAKTECIGLNYWRSLQQGLHDWEPGKEIRLIH